MDLSEELLASARSRAEKEGVVERLTFKRADVTALPLPDDHFEFVLSQDMLQVVTEPITLLDELKRVTKPEGFFYLQAIKRSWLAALAPILTITYSASEARELLGRSKLSTNG